MACRISPIFTQNQYADDLLILTVNRRLSSQLQNQFDVLQKENDRLVWKTPSILPIDSWIIHTWQRYSNSCKLLLSPWQSLELWAQIANPQIAKRAQQAWKLLNQWNLSLNDLENSHIEEVQVFLEWAKEFSNHCKTNNWITHSEVIREVITLIESNKVALPKQIFLMGFDELTPAIKLLCDVISTVSKICIDDTFKPTETNALDTEDVVKINLDSCDAITEQQSVPLHRLNPVIASAAKQSTSNQTPRKARTTHTLLQDEQTELEHMARWAKQFIQDNPGKQIACVIPNLGSIRENVHHTFTQIFSPENILPGWQADKPPFNISAGIALGSLPMIRDAMQILQLLSNQIDLSTFGTFIQSPYCALMPEDQSIASLLDEQLRRYDREHLPLHTAFNPLTKLQEQYANTSLLNRWRRLTQQAQQKPESATPSQWCELFSKTLSDFGWPGYRTRESREYQIITRWQKMLLEFSQLDLITAEMSFKEALDHIKTMAQDTLFQAQGSEAAVQILGVLETAGAQFDAIWMMGLHSGAWPAAASPHPLLPKPMQIQHRMPHADASRELEYAKQLTQRLSQSAPLVIFSSPTQAGDQILQPSQLITGFPYLETKQAVQQTYAQQLFANSSLETSIDAKAPAVSSDEAVQGGSWILKLQAACPFRAQASIRLNANPLQNPTFGISAADRGTIVHHVLDQIWLHLGTKDQLCALSDAELNQLIEQTVLKAINDFFNDDDSPGLLRVEQKRLTRLVQQWLDVEKQRYDFSVVQRESKRQVKLGHLTLNLQIDRIDELHDGTHIVIDYKTGYSTPQHWFSERLTEPQLPLYCAYGQQQTDDTSYQGLAFAQLLPGKLEYKGIISEKFLFEPSDFPGVTSINQLKQIDNTLLDWQSAIERWQQQLQQLADEFCQGRADVEPQPSACLYCDLHSFCRVSER